MFCETCKYAIRDYAEYYGGARQYFVVGCKNKDAIYYEDSDGEVTECDSHVEDVEW